MKPKLFIALVCIAGLALVAFAGFLTERLSEMPRFRHQKCGLSSCEKCGTCWHLADDHTTFYGDGGCFPLCQSCWASMNPKERLPYYHNWYFKYQSDHQKWREIKKAVLDGK